MGIINLTPDSFAQDGLYAQPSKALRRARAMVREGADIIDVGAESTRPGHAQISVDEELSRLVPVLQRLRSALDVPLSVDTYKYEVARAAADLGADMINDVWGLERSPQIADLAAQRGLALTLMHNRTGTTTGDLMADINQGLQGCLDRALRAGVARDRILLDPGIGFGKAWEQNYETLRRLPEMRSLGQPVLVGTSRKSFIGRLLDLPVERRIFGTAASVAVAVVMGADVVRVHDVAQMCQVIRVADRVVRP